MLRTRRQFAAASEQNVPSFMLRTLQVPVSPHSLDPRYVFFLDAGKKLFVWIGRRSKNVTRSKARFVDNLWSPQTGTPRC